MNKRNQLIQQSIIGLFAGIGGVLYRRRKGHSTKGRKNYFVNYKGQMIHSDGSTASAKAHIAGIVYINAITAACIWIGYKLGREALMEDNLISDDTFKVDLSEHLDGTAAHPENQFHMPHI
jgi:hypothetical protein